jgi:hypothetical protein
MAEITDITVYVKGPQGVKGDTGDDAYQNWLSLGNVGTMQDFMDYLKASATPLSSTAPVNLNTVPSAGVSTSASRSDHSHRMPTYSEVGAEPAGRVTSGVLAHNNDVNAHAYTPPIGPSIAVKGYLDRNKMYVGSGDEVQDAIDYASSIGGRSVDLIKTLYLVDSVQMKEGVTLQYDAGYAISVQHLLDDQARGLPVFRCGAITGDFFVVPNTAYDNTIRNFVIDARSQVSGNALRHADTSLTAQRTGSRIENILVRKNREGAAWKIDLNHKEGSFNNVFLRCGDTVTDINAGYVGLDCASIDWYGNRLLVGFPKNRGIVFTGGACRFDNVDAWGSQDINAEIAGSSSSWNRLQVDTAVGGGLLLPSTQNAAFNSFVCLSNAQGALVATDDVTITGDSLGVTFINPQMRGSTSANIGYAFAADATSRSVPSIIGGVFATSYTAPYNDRMQAYGNIIGGGFINRPLRSVSIPTELNTNPVFGNFSGGVPVDWSIRGSSVPTQITTISQLPTDGDYSTGARITSGAVGVSGIQFIVANPEKYRGRTIIVKALAKGSPVTYLGNQRIEIFDSHGSAGVEVIKNDAIYGVVAIKYKVPVDVTLIQIRLVAANDTTTGLVLDVTDVSIKAF